MTVTTQARVVRVTVDVTGIDKEFDYLVNDPEVRVGSEVRVRLGARRVRGWVTACDVSSPHGVTLQPVLAVRGYGPAHELIELAHWAAHRFVGHPVNFLRIASAPAMVRSLGVPGTGGPPFPATLSPLAADVLKQRVSVARVPPLVDRIPLIAELLAHKMAGRFQVSAIVVCPTVDAVKRLVPRLAKLGFDVVDYSLVGTDSQQANAWARAAAGGRVIVGTRSAAWAPAPNLVLSMLVDEHDEALQSTRTPTWHARDVLDERSRRAGVHFVSLSPCPSLDVLSFARCVTLDRAVERSGWPIAEIIDRRGEDPRTASSVLAASLGEHFKDAGRVVCVLNRTGRVRLLACRSCDAIARCVSCGAATHAPKERELVCPRCATRRPRVCAECGSGVLKNLRIGVGRAREELAALLNEPVDEGDDDLDRSPHARVVIGTEAVLHRVRSADLVAFLDFDSEVAAPRFRAGEQAMTLLARGAKLLGHRSMERRILIQTRIPEHPVIRALVHGDPSILVAAERPIREELSLPPFGALALLSGPGAASVAAQLTGDTVQLMPSGSGAVLVRAASHEQLSDALHNVIRPSARVRIEVDPLRV